MALYPRVNILSLCSGIGGLDLGVSKALRRLGYDPRVVCYVEGEAYAASVLVKQMEEGNLDQAPIWSDIKTFDCEPWRGKVDLVIGGYPCQPFSKVGRRRGKDDPKHLWPHVLRVLVETGASLLFCENVRGHVSEGLGEVLGQVSCFGFDAEWDLFSAEEEGAPHKRERLFLLAHSRSSRCSVPDFPTIRQERGTSYASQKSLQNQQRRDKDKHYLESNNASEISRKEGWPTEPDILRVVDGLPNQLDRTRALGNAVVPACAETAFTELWRRSKSED